MAVQAIDVVCLSGAQGLLDTAAHGVINVAGGGCGAGAKSAVDLNESIFGVIEIGVAAVVGHVAGGVVLVGWADELVLRIHALAETAGSRTGALASAIAPGIVAPGEGIRIR